jgi:hypothetical protein
MQSNVGRFVFNYLLNYQNCNLQIKTIPFVNPKPKKGWATQITPPPDAQRKQTNLQLTVCKLDVCICSLIPCSIKKAKKQNLEQFATIFAYALKC